MMVAGIDLGYELWQFMREHDRIESQSISAPELNELSETED